MLRALIASVFAVGLAASGCAEEPASVGEDAATGFYRPGATAPASADLSRGDVPRDEYGRPYTYEGLGAPLPEFSGETTDQTSFSSSLLEGRWTVIEVWGIWCHDSRRDATYAAALSRALAQDPDVDFMSIHTPHNADSTHRALRGYDSVSAWFDEKGWEFLTVVDEDASIREALKIRWTPTYLLVAPDLTVQGFRTGLADAGDDAVKTFVQDIALTRADWDTD
ncbi:MAG: TlpA family protein disulfide reductase [Hyphomonadaceae bacterium]|nr:TlpA family protein disulfide reductase [Hyphomonadaceae bacterium]